MSIPSAPPDPSASPEPTAPADPSVPRALRVASEVCARVLVIVVALALLLWLLVTLRIVAIPVAIALLLSALLAPVVSWLTRRGVPRGVATAIVLVGGIAVLATLLTFVVNTFISGLPALQTQLTASLTTVEQLLTAPPINLPTDWLANLPAQIGTAISANRAALTSGALSTAASITEVVAGLALTLFSLIFLLHDGPGIWRFLLGLTPVLRRDRIDTAGRRAFASLVGYVRATVLVAFVDAFGIGLGLAIVGVPLVIPLAALVFLGSFIPTVGAVLTGGVAVLIALVADGPVAALIILAVVVAVQQLEGHILQPLLLGRAVRLHPLAVVLSVGSGVIVAGVTGALLAVPLLAVLNTAVRSLTSPVEQLPALVDAVNPRHAQPVREAAPPNPVVTFLRRATRRRRASPPSPDPG